MDERDRISGAVIGAAIEVHRLLGPGLLESVYEECLCHELALRSVQYQRQCELPVLYKECKLESGFRMDILVENTVVVELKAVEKVLPIHQAQLLTYMRLSGKSIGLLLNFHELKMKDGIFRFVL